MDLKSLIYYKLVFPLAIKLDKIMGLDFLSDIHAEEVGLDPKLVHNSSPSSKRFLKRVLNDFTISPLDSIIDIGCGKGYALRTMLKFHFEKVDGIELSSHIANIATQNFKRLNSKRTKIFTGDATQFNEYDAYNFIYLFNPFPSVVMSEVIHRLIQSIRRSDREVVIIYLAPVCNEVIVSNGLFTKTGIYHRKGSWITIYSNRSFNESKLSTNKKMCPIAENSALSDELEDYLEKHQFSQKEYCHSLIQKKPILNE